MSSSIRDEEEEYSRIVGCCESSVFVNPFFFFLPSFVFSHKLCLVKFHVTHERFRSHVFTPNYYRIDKLSMNFLVNALTFESLDDWWFF